MFQKAYAFNGDIGAWDVSPVTDMSMMFDMANSFNANIGAWDVSSVTTMEWILAMLETATAFDQDLGWCVATSVVLSNTFINSACEATSCGVKHGGCDAYTR